MKITLAPILALLCNIAIADSWVPPPDPEPRVILNEARDDFISGNFKDSLAKHRWFHENALMYRKSLYGVRLSFALSDWRRLSEEYPPALDALIQTAKQSEHKVREGVDVYSNFHDFESLNVAIGSKQRTVELFIWLDKNHPERAKKVYRLAEESLTDAKEYLLCGKYIDPDNSYLRYVSDFRSTLDYAKKSRVPDVVEKSAHRSFAKSVSTLVALLAINRRTSEAVDIAEMALLEWGDSNFKAQLDKAIEANVPAS